VTFTHSAFTGNDKIKKSMINFFIGYLLLLLKLMQLFQ